MASQTIMGMPRSGSTTARWKIMRVLKMGRTMIRLMALWGVETGKIYGEMEDSGYPKEGKYYGKAHDDMYVNDRAHHQYGRYITEKRNWVQVDPTKLQGIIDACWCAAILHVA